MRKLCMFSMAAFMALSMNVVAFAESSTVPVKITQTPIKMNITVSESIDISLAANTVDASVTDLVVQNNATVGNVKVTKIAVADSADYVLSGNGEAYETMPMNTKKYSLVHESHDFSTGAAVVDYTINPTQSKNIAFTSKVAPTLVKLDKTQIANATVTIGLDTAAPVGP